ncbi:MAG: glycosyltransferase family 39 protein [Myxococcales bacterium]|nr:glycosyltransferase family 39 protein [Myxococcales bacterium]MCB9712870.1 glycosyltransferase family 39 protein [Myxococcales bacterium]
MEERRRRAWAAALALLVIGGLSAWLRAPGFTQGGFASHDVAGILHGAMLLHDGALPYVDSIELKAPGTFYLAALLAGPGGTDIAAFQVWANLWALASLGVVAAIAWRLWGPAAAVVAALLYGLHDAHLDSMDANYVTWAQLPLVAAVGAALVAPRAATRRRELGWWVAAGLLAGAAALLKRPAGVGGVVVMAMALWPGAGERTSIKARVLAVLAGGLGSHLPVALHYAAAGELGALVDGYLRSRWGMRYVSQGGEPFGLAAIEEGMLATAFFVALPLALALFAAVPPRDREARRITMGLALWSLGTLAVAWVGLRFYKGYFLAVSAPLCLWAAAPWGLLGASCRVRRWGRWVLLLPALLLALRQLAVLEHQRVDRDRPHDQGGRVIAKVVSGDRRPGDRIWVWGWHLWDVYPLTGMRSASRVYKSLGLLTPPNDDTWRRPASRLRFVDGEAAAILLEDLQASRPAWIVLGSTVPRAEFRALNDFLREHYLLERKVRLGRVQFWHRRDRAQAQRAAAAARRAEPAAP